MHWKLLLTREKGRLSLQKDGAEAGACEWQENRNTSREIFQAMRKLAQEAGITPHDVEKFKLETDLPEHATARRIAETIQKVYTLGISA